MKFKNTEYGDLTNQSIKNSINVKSKFLTSLEGCPKKVNGNFDCYHNKLTSLEYSPEIVNGLFFCSYNKLKILKGNVKEINGVFNCENNPNLKNVREEIIKYGIKANYYETDYGFFDFKDIEEEFNNSYLKHKKNEENIKKIEENKKHKSKIKQNKTIINQKDYGLSI